MDPPVRLGPLHGHRVGCTEAEAQARVLTERPGDERRRRRNQEFREAQEAKLAEFPLLSKNRVRKVAIDFLMTLFVPYATVIARKNTILHERSKLLENRKELLEELRAATDPGEVERLCKVIEALDEDVQGTEVYMAFRERAKTAEEHARFVLAAEYADCWVELKDSAGNFVGSLMTFFWCCAGGAGNRCHTLTASKRWLQRFLDPLATKQRWYCPTLWCGAKYRAGRGMILEVSDATGKPMHARCEVHPDALDLKAAFLEMEINPETPEELFAKIPEVSPFLGEGSVWRKATASEVTPGHSTEGVFKLLADEAWVNSLPHWPWAQVFNFFTQK